MKRLFICTLMILLAFSGVLSAKSKILVEDLELDFGEVNAGAIAEVTFKFKNVGDETLTIKNIGSSCGCTVPKLDKKEYAPGESGELPVKFDSKGYEGNVVKSITLSSSDEESPTLSLKIKGNVVLKDFARAEIAPEKLDFAAVKMGKEYSKKISIKNTGTIDLRIIDINHSPEFYLLFNKKSVAPGESMDVKIVFTPMTEGRFVNFMRLRTNTHKRPTWIIKVTADVGDKKGVPAG